MKKRAITRGYEILLDDEDFERFIGVPMFALPKSNGVYALVKIKGKMKRVHRLIMGEPPGPVDHINRNTLDCQRHNLRAISHSGNSRNCKVRGVSRFLGVSPGSAPGKWQSAIRDINSDKVFLGIFVSEISAAAAYDNYLLHNPLEGSRLNFPDGLPSGWEKDRVTKQHQKLRRTKFGYFGIAKTTGHRWQVRLYDQSLGAFDSIEDACRVYNEAALAKYGPHIELNIPKQSDTLSCPKPRQGAGNIQLVSNFVTINGYFPSVYSSSSSERKLGRVVHKLRHNYRLGRLPETSITACEIIPGWRWKIR